MQRNFLGLTDGLLLDERRDVRRAALLEGMRDRRFMTGVANYHIYKAEICFFYGALWRSAGARRAQDQLIASAMSLPQLVRFYIVAFLTLAACLHGMDSDEQARTRKRMRAGRQAHVSLGGPLPCKLSASAIAHAGRAGSPRWPC